MREYTSIKRVTKIVNAINTMCVNQNRQEQMIRVWGKMNNGRWCFRDVNNRPIYDANMETKDVLPFLFGYFHAIKKKEFEDELVKKCFVEDGVWAGYKGG